MPKGKSKVLNKTLHSQTRKIVSNVHEFIKREVEAGEVLIKLKKFKRVLHKLQVF